MTAAPRASGSGEPRRAAAAPGLISVIMPCFNDERFLTEAISSIQAQSYKNWELLFLDDGSSDESVHIARSFSDPRIRIFEFSHCGQVAKVRNVGLENARGEFIAFLDSDDTYAQDALADLCAVLKDDGNIACGLRAGMDRGGVPFDLGDPIPGHDIESILLGKSIANLQTYLFSKKTVDSVGKFDDKFDHRSDIQFILRCVLLFPGGIRRLPSPVFNYRIRPDSRSHSEKNLRNLAVEAILFLNWAFDLPEISSRKKFLVSEAYTNAYATLARSSLNQNNNLACLRFCWAAWKDDRVRPRHWAGACLRQLIRAFLPDFLDGPVRSLWRSLARKPAGQ